MRIRRRHWLAALGLAALVHAGFAAFFSEVPAVPVGAADAQRNGPLGIAIGLGPAAGAVQAGAAPREHADPVRRTPSRPAQVPSTPKARPRPQRRQQVESAARTRSRTVRQTPAPRQGKRSLRSTPVRRPAPVAQAKPAAAAARPSQTPATAPAVAAPRPSPVGARAPAKRTPDRGADSPARARASSPATAATTSSSGAAQAAAVGRKAAPAAGGGASGVQRDYLVQLSAWLERHKRYPSRARRRGQQGTVYLRFVVDRGGRVLSHRIERSSGHAVLDRAVEQLIRRAEPLPAMPAAFTPSRLELVVPVSFYMR